MLNMLVIGCSVYKGPLWHEAVGEMKYILHDKYIYKH